MHKFRKTFCSVIKVIFLPQNKKNLMLNCSQLFFDPFLQYFSRDTNFSTAKILRKKFGKGLKLR